MKLADVNLLGQIGEGHTNGARPGSHLPGRACS